MRFSLKSDYAIIALLDMALNADKGPVHVRSIALRRSIPLKFLEQVMSALKKAGLVESFRGAQGGYILARNPEKISLAQVVEAIEGPIAPMDCTIDSNEYRCRYISVCVLREVWKEVKQSIDNVLKKISLADICKKAKEQELTVMYHI